MAGDKITITNISPIEHNGVVQSYRVRFSRTSRLGTESDVYIYDASTSGNSTSSKFVPLIDIDSIKDIIYEQIKIDLVNGDEDSDAE